MDNVREERRKMVMLGELPDDFLRINTTVQTINSNHQANQPVVMSQYGFGQTSGMGTLGVTLGQAELVKSYGVTRMDPYVRIRIGHNSYETPADVRGGKFPTWNKTFYVCVPPGIKTISIEVFDERSIIPDERIAWAYYNLPDEVFQGTYVEKWIPLSGRQGEGKEGKIYVTFSYKPSNLCSSPVAPSPYMVVPTPMYGGVPYYSPVPLPVVYPPSGPPVHPHPVRPRPQLSEQEIKQIQEMFPSFEKDVIIGVLENSGGNKDHAINALLSMGSDR